jgi:hypothetical protein
MFDVMRDPNAPPSKESVTVIFTQSACDGLGQAHPDRTVHRVDTVNHV